MEPVYSNRTSTYMAAEDAIAEVKLQLAEEKNHRLDLEKELELQMNMRAETEVALKLLEKDIHEKQDTIISLRKQLEDIKIINLEMFRKLQVSCISFTHSLLRLPLLVSSGFNINKHSSGIIGRVSYSQHDFL